MQDVISKIYIVVSRGYLEFFGKLMDFVFEKGGFGFNFLYRDVSLGFYEICFVMFFLFF